MRPSKQAARAFTLVELLIVVAIIGILSALILPALANAKARGQAAYCLNNVRGLSIAWHLYADDENDTLPFNLGSSEIHQDATRGVFRSWNNSVLSWELDSDNTNIERVIQGGIGPYTSGAAKLYRCPSDFAVSDLQARAGWTARVRSYSMNAMVGNAGEFSKLGTNTNNPHYRQFFKLTQIPEPSEIFVFIEEHPDSINDGYFINKFYVRRWMDLPASWHQGICNLLFADGHGEMHKWRCASTQPPPRPDSANLPLNVPANEPTDFDWLMARTSLNRE